MSLRKRGWTRVAIAKILKIDYQPAHRFGHLLIGQVQERIIFPAFQVYIIIKLSFFTTMLLNLATKTLQCRLRKCNDAKIPDTVSVKRLKKQSSYFELNVEVLRITPEISITACHHNRQKIGVFWYFCTQQASPRKSNKKQHDCNRIEDQLSPDMQGFIKIGCQWRFYHPFLPLYQVP